MPARLLISCGLKRTNCTLSHHGQGTSSRAGVGGCMQGCLVQALSNNASHVTRGSSLHYDQISCAECARLQPLAELVIVLVDCFLGCLHRRAGSSLHRGCHRLCNEIEFARSLEVAALAEWVGALAKTRQCTEQSTLKCTSPYHTRHAKFTYSSEVVQVDRCCTVEENPTSASSGQVGTTGCPAVASCLQHPSSRHSRCF